MNAFEKVNMDNYGFTFRRGFGVLSLPNQTSRIVLHLILEIEALVVVPLVVVIQMMMPPSSAKPFQVLNLTLM